MSTFTWKLNYIIFFIVLIQTYAAFVIFKLHLLFENEGF